MPQVTTFLFKEQRRVQCMARRPRFLIRCGVLSSARKTVRPQQAEEALAALCQTYWNPVYAFLRRTGRGPHGAQDLTERFLQHVLRNDFLKNIQREKGRVHTFLLTGA